MKHGLSSRVAVLASFSALYGLIGVFPTFPVIGLPGVHFPLSDVLPAVYGVLLGPWLGFLAVFIGRGLSILFGKPPILLGLDPIPASLNTLLVGFVVKGLYSYAALLYIGTLAVFMMNPLSQTLIEVSLGFINAVVPFHWMHLAVSPALAPPLAKRFKAWIERPSGISKGFSAFFILSLAGTLYQHSSGGLLWTAIYGYVLNVLTAEEFRSIWTAVFWLYPVERLLLASSSAVIGVSAVKVLSRFKARLLQPLKDEPLLNYVGEGYYASRQSVVCRYGNPWAQVNH